MLLRRVRRSVGRHLRRRLGVSAMRVTTWNVLAPGEVGSWSGRTVAVTGAAGLVGAATVEAFVRGGATVHAIDLRGDVLSELVARHGDRVVAHEADLIDPLKVQQVAQHIAGQTSSLDALVHCLGHNDWPADTSSISAESWARVLAVNVTAPAMVTSALTPQLGAVRSAGVVMLTSVNGRAPSLWPHYAAAKAALAKLTRDLALQLAPLGIRVNAVAPGWTFATTPGEVAQPAPRIPLTRSVIPVEAVVNAMLFLADPAASPCTTGQELAVDGGFEIAGQALPGSNATA